LFFETTAVEQVMLCVKLAVTLMSFVRYFVLVLIQNLLTVKYGLMVILL